MKFDRKDKEQVEAIVNRLHSLQENSGPPYDIDTIFKKLDIEVCEVNCPTQREMNFKMPILERLSDNFYRLYVAKSQDTTYTYYKKTIGLMMCLFNNLKIGEQMTNYDIIKNKNKINDFMNPVMIEFLIPTELLNQDFMNPKIVRNPNLFLSKTTKKYCVPSSLMMFRVIKFMEGVKQQMKDEGIDVDQMMKEMQEMQREMEEFDDNNNDDDKE